MFRTAEDDSKSGSVRPRVLVVDDDPVTLEVVRERLETLGYAVTVRDEAIGTAQWIAHEQPEFVLLDVSMPALSGTGLAQILGRNSSTRSTAVILHSSRDAATLQELANSVGAIGAIEKTSDASHFIREFARIAARR